MTLLADVVAASRDLSATRSRSRKVAILADILGRLDPDEVPAAVGFLSGVPRQGRVGIGYRTIFAIDVPPGPQPSLTVADVDRAIDEVCATTGAGSGKRRAELLANLLRRATADETDFLRRLFTGNLRQGSLAGLMAEADCERRGSERATCAPGVDALRRPHIHSAAGDRRGRG